jgi:hypothetical protein
MTTMPPRRRQILNFIRSHAASEGHPPSLAEIASACGLKTRSAAQKHVKALEASGELEVTQGKARSTRPKQRKVSAAGIAPFFEVSVQDIVGLNDSDLRELVARLCMASLADVGLPPTPVTWGGDQRAPDGGIDVRVQLPTGTAASTRFARAVTGIQVKATKMGPGEIQREMCPNGLLRPSIQDLIRAKGSYIIATSDSAADEEYRKRVAAMKAAVTAEADHAKADFDFFDARRLADWTNQHPGVVAWARNRLGRPLQGWKPHGQWADTRGGKPQPFLPDEKNRFVDPHEPERKLSLSEGLTHVRNALRTGGRSVRLTGLSGVGKTRFAQALFEVAAAPEPLPADLAVYTDTSHSPNPPPLAVLDELLASGRRAILVVDNCAPQLHNQLTSRCKSSSLVSLLTIEYDIREDLPNETNVFHLETGSSDLIENIIAQQFPQISQTNIGTIAKFADGNSRVAIALANTMDRNESLAGLNDRELFDRLFWLGKDVQNELMIAAQVCALVYSFDGEDLDGELAQLGRLADQSVTALYRHVVDLEDRGLAQRRGVWRAVLPHAVANTLAARALDSIPYPLIERHLVQCQDRLLRSFSRRLGYLHDSPKAIAITYKWLSAGGLLGDIALLTPLLVEVLVNVAPVAPEGTLEAIERAVRGPDGTKVLSLQNEARVSLVRLIRLIAYDSKLFERCIEVLMAFALAEAPDSRVDSTRNVIESLFSLYLSGTHATTAQRVSWVRGALESPNHEIESIGRKCLCAALKCDHFSSHYGFEFGARPRDYGWSPRRGEAQAWFASFVGLAAEIGQGDSHAASYVRELLAEHFRSLWTVAGITDALEAAAIPLLNTGWEKGWLAIRQTIRFEGKELPPANKARLRSLEERAKPKTLVGHVKAIVVSGYSSSVDFADGEAASTGYERAEQLACDLGKQVAGDAEVLAEVLPLVVQNVQGRLWRFGEGLAIGTGSLDACWSALLIAFEAIPEEQRSVQVLRGFLNGAFHRKRATFEHILDASMNRPSLTKWVPVLQLSAPLDDHGCARLLASMANPDVPAWVFQHLGFGRATEKLSDDLLAQLLQELSLKPDGLEVALDVLSMHIFNNPNPVGARVRQVAHALLARVPLTRHNQRLDYALGRLIQYFLKGSDGEAVARELLKTVRNGLDTYNLSRFDLTETLAALFSAYPKVALDLLVSDDPEEGSAYYRRSALAGGRRSSALAHVPIETLIAWCIEGGPDRWPAVAPLIPAFESSDDKTKLNWSENILALLKRAPNPIKVAESLVSLIEPMSWSGSRAEAIKQRLPLLDELADVLGPDHAAQVTAWRSQITKTIEREARRELEEHRTRDERFE